jgi:UPF0176 protein
MTVGTQASSASTDNIAETDHAVVLFYHYFVSSGADNNFEEWWKDVTLSVETLYQHQQRICQALNLTGRILIAEEGINGTIAGQRRHVKRYIQEMKEYTGNQEQELLGKMVGTNQTNTQRPSGQPLFRKVDWKTSFVNGNLVNNEREMNPLFPDLKISIVKEIVSTAGLVDVQDIPSETAKHLSPEEFHEILLSQTSDENQRDSNQKISGPPVVLIDVRNTFEHDIGHFVHPKTGESAMNPEMTTFSSFDLFCQRRAEDLKGKQVLMYCTGL